MRQLDPIYVPMMNTTTWFFDAGHVRVMQPQTGRDVILPRRFAPVWEGIEQGLNVGALVRRVGAADPPLEEDEVATILRGLEKLDLITLTHPCWTDAPEG